MEQEEPSKTTLISEDVDVEVSSDGELFIYDNMDGSFVDLDKEACKKLVKYINENIDKIK